jgi:hypothetical protein
LGENSTVTQVPPNEYLLCVHYYTFWIIIDIQREFAGFIQRAFTGSALEIKKKP